MSEEPVVIDARGLRCPAPTLKLRKALETASLVRLLADDPLARIDVPHFAGQIGAQVLEISEEGRVLAFLVSRQK